MVKLTKRQQKRINYFLREKAERQHKQDMIHDGQAPKFIERHLPFVRKLARNLDQLLIVSSMVSPPIKTGLIDRFLVLSEIEKLPAIICINKVDLLKDLNEAEALAKIYRQIGYSVILTSAKSGKGLDELNEALQKKRSALVGHSGVGKSSLLNAIEPNLEISVNEVSKSTNKGKHTTTKIRLYTLNPQTEVVDLPGIKLIDFIDIHRDEARFFFKEFDEPAQYCKFRDCLHLSDDACAVKLEIQEGKISSMRYQSYLNFVETLS